MRTLICLLAATPAFAHVTCWTMAGAANGTWNGTTCSGTKPMVYRLTNTQSDGTTPLTVVEQRAESQAVVKDAHLDDRIEYTAGQEFQIGESTGFGVLIDGRPGTGELVITSTEWAKLPPEGTRITPVYYPLLPRLLVHRNSPVFAFPNSARPAEHIRFSGLYFGGSSNLAPNGSSSVNLDLALNYGVFRIGSGPTDGINNVTGTTQNGDSALPFDTLPSSSSSGQPVLAVSDGALYEPGQIIYIGAHGETVPHYEVQSVASNNVTLTANLASTASSGQRVFTAAIDPTHAPDDITIDRNVFHNQKHRYQMERFIVTNGRTTTIRDNWFSAPLSSIGGKDTQVISGSSTIGPITIANNYIDGGTENIMWGGSYGGYDNLFVSADITKNFISHQVERDQFWYWTTTQDAGETRGNPGGLGIVPGHVKVRAGIILPGLSPDYSPRLIFAGRHVMSSTDSTVRFVARNTGVVGTTEPDWTTLAPNAGDQVWDVDPARTNPAVYGTRTCDGATQNGDGVCWERVGSSVNHKIKNNFELKLGKNVTLRYNVLDWFGSEYGTNLNQAYGVNIKEEGNEGTSGACTAGDPFPLCFRAQTKDITIENNVLRAMSGFVLMSGASGSTNGGPPTGGNGNYTVRNNIMVQTECPNWTVYNQYRAFNLIPNASDTTTARTLDMAGFRIDNNTVYSPCVSDDVQSVALSTSATSVTHPGALLAPLSFAGNIIARQTASASMAYASAANRTDGGVMITDYFPATSTQGGTWGKNGILGAPSAGFPSVYTGCGTSAACVTAASYPTSLDPAPSLQSLYDALFVRASVDARGRGGIWQIRRDSSAWRTGDNGVNLGADPNQVPEIRNLNVQTTDRAALIQWTVTPPIANTPCVLEGPHTSPDIESIEYDGTQATWHGANAVFAAEMGSIGTYYGRESSDYNGYIKPDRGLARMIAVGSAVNLSPDTAYFFRLHCGGDTYRGSFTTAAALSGNTTLKTSGSSLTWGTSYARDTDTISGGGSGSCSGGSCTASVPKGSVIYYRSDSKPVRAIAAK